MEKYIDADKLKSKVKELNITTKTYEEQVSFSTALLMVTELIDSLQQEQQEVDLDKEIETEWKKCNPVDEGMGVESTYMHIEAFDMIARHFYELRKNSK
jgi:hypothetical protein